MERSRKLKLLTPKPLAAAREAYNGGASALKPPPQRPMKEGGCIAASGEEASIMMSDQEVVNDLSVWK